jgi:hypothetical protein
MSERPLAVTIVCVLGAVAALITVTLLSFNGLWAVPPTGGQRAVALGAAAMTVAVLYGLWRMRRWGVILMAALLLIRVAYGLAAHVPWNPPALAGPTLILLVGLLYLRRMT